MLNACHALLECFNNEAFARRVQERFSFLDNIKALNKKLCMHKILNLLKNFHNIHVIRRFHGLFCFYFILI